MNQIVNTLFGLVFISNFYVASAQKLEIKSKTVRIEINADTSFTKRISIRFKENGSLLAYPIFFDSELEEVANIQVRVRKGKKLKPFKDFLIKEEKVELDYIASKKVKSVILPSGPEYELSYTISCRELMYFSGLPFFSQHAIDTLRYQVSMTDDFHLAHNRIHSDRLKHFIMDSTLKDGLKRWDIEVVPDIIEPDPLTFFGIYRNKKSPLMRIVVVPAAYENKEHHYLNDWYLGEIKYKKELDAEAIRRIDELTLGISEPQRIIEILYDYVRHKFKYVAIEIGMGAFIPSHTNEVFGSKQGDCKDLSNFLVEALKYKNIEGHLALAATKSHISDCDFPSLSSANHIVCLITVDDRPTVLDPTDPIHVMNTPVQSLQNRTLLIFNQNGGQWFKVEGNSSKENLVAYEMRLVLNSESRSLEGDFKADYHGITGNFLKRELWYNSLEKGRANTMEHYENIFNNQSFTDFHIESNSEVVTAKGRLRLAGKIFQDGTNTLLFMDFLPRLFETVNRETMLEGMQLDTNFSKKVNVLVTLDQPIVPFDTIQHEINGQNVGLGLSISNAGEYMVRVEYQFHCDYDRMESNNIEEVNRILNAYKKIINDPIILKQKI